MAKSWLALVSFKIFSYASILAFCSSLNSVIFSFYILFLTFHISFSKMFFHSIFLRIIHILVLPFVCLLDIKTVLLSLFKIFSFWILFIFLSYFPFKYINLLDSSYQIFDFLFPLFWYEKVFLWEKIIWWFLFWCCRVLYFGV